MKILFLVPYIPSRIRIRPYEFIRHLAKIGHSVTVATQFTNHDEENDLEVIKPYCEQILSVPISTTRSIINSILAIPTQSPLQSSFSWNPTLAKKALVLLNQSKDPKYDIIHVEHLRGVRFGLFLQKHVDIPIVWDSVDCISHLFRQSSISNPKRLQKLINKFELPRTEAFERKMLHQFNKILVTSSNDREALLGLNLPGSPVPPIEIVTNGVDLDYFHPGLSPRQPDTIVISGKMSYHANIHMVLHLIADIMPLVWRQRPQVKVWVVGKDPPDSIRTFSNDPRITVTGMVDDIRPYLQTATVAASPLGYGAGVQNKVLEAMACATPVVSSSLAVSALQVKQGQQVLVADQPSDFAQRILDVLENPSLAMSVGQAGRLYVESTHQWDGIAKHLQNIYTDLIVAGH